MRRKEGYPPPPGKNATPAEISKHYRDAARGGPPRKHIPCGTHTYDEHTGDLKGSWAPIMRHKRAGDNPLDCELCAPIMRELQKNVYRKRKKGSEVTS